MEGALLLSLSAMVVKIIGALYKIPIANVLGGVGMSYFSTAYEIFNPIYALTVTGLSVAVSKLVSQYTALGQPAEARRIFRKAIGLFIPIGLLGSAAILAGAEPFVRFVNNPGALWAVLAIAPAVFFSCISAAFRGYYQGLQNMRPTAAAQVIEAVIKLICGVILAYWVTNLGLRGYLEQGHVFGVQVASSEAAQFAVLPFSAAAAVVGITLSTLAGMLYIFFHHRSRLTVHDKPRTAGSANPHYGRLLLRIALPVALSGVAVNLTSMIDLASVMNRLQTAVEQNPGVFLRMYEGLIPAGMASEMLPEYLYGSYSGMAVSIFNLLPSITTAFGISALPAINAHFTRGNLTKTTDGIRQILRFTLILAVPAGLGISVLAHPILNLLFSSRSMETAIIAPALRIMGISSIFVAVVMPLNSILQGVGRLDLPVKLMLIGGAVKLVCNYFVVAIPTINIQGVPYGTLLCYAVILILSLFALRGMQIQVGLFGLALKPLLAGIGCAATAFFSYSFLYEATKSAWAVIISVLLGGIIYIILLLFMGGFTKNDIISLPGGQKIIKMLDKSGKIR